MFEALIVINAIIMWYVLYRAVLLVMEKWQARVEGLYIRKQSMQARDRMDDITHQAFIAMAEHAERSRR
jgi:hypothetical protein